MCVFHSVKCTPSSVATGCLLRICGETQPALDSWSENTFAEGFSDHSCPYLRSEHRHEITASKHPTHHSYHPCMQLPANRSCQGSLKMLMHHANARAVLRMTMTLKQHHGFSLSVSGSVLTSRTCSWEGAFFGPRVFHGSPGHQTTVTCQLLRRCSGSSMEGVAPKLAEPAPWSSGRSTPAQQQGGLQAAGEMLDFCP